jgi:hypothetical protein
MHDDSSAGRAGWLVPDLLGRLSCGNGKRGPSGPLFRFCIYDEVGVVGETMRRGVIVYSARLHIAGAGAEPEARGAARNSLWQPRDGGDLADYRAAWRGGPGKAIVD